MKKIKNIFYRWALSVGALNRCLNLFEGAIVGILGMIALFFSKFMKIFHWLFGGLDRKFTHAARKSLAEHTKVERKVMFLTFQGTYTCSARAIADELIRQGVDCTLVWDVKTAEPQCEYPLQLKTVCHDTVAFYEELASSKVVIENTNIMERLDVVKNPSQVVMQTWHGSMGIKRLDGDVVMGKEWKDISRRCQENVDYLLSDSQFETDVFQKSYWPGVTVLNTGHARNDIFFWTDKKRIEENRRKVYELLEIPENRKIFLYAPTHRDDEPTENLFIGIDFKDLRSALTERFGGEWQIVLRLHNRLKKQRLSWIRNLPSYVTDATDYGDMQEILAVTEVGVTDYSSWIFDYVLGRKPGFIIERGLEEFKNARGFYYPMEETPFPIAEDFRGLCENIRKFDAETYDRRIDEFLEARGCFEDGHASERIVEKIKEILEEV